MRKTGRAGTFPGGVLSFVFSGVPPTLSLVAAFAGGLAPFALIDPGSGAADHETKKDSRKKQHEQRKFD